MTDNTLIRWYIIACGRDPRVIPTSPAPHTYRMIGDNKPASAMAALSIEDTICKLFDVDGLKFGKFTMRTGEMSPVYVDMRVIWSYPDIVVRLFTFSSIIAQTRKYVSMVTVLYFPSFGFPPGDFPNNLNVKPPICVRRQIIMT